MRAPSRSRPRSFEASSTANWSPLSETWASTPAAWPASVAVARVGLAGVGGGLLIGERVPDRGLVAHVVGVRRDLVDGLLVAGQVPVVAPPARAEGGIGCNVNADDGGAGAA